jgi:Uma2 family endonuclease
MATQVTLTEPESLVPDSLVVHFGDMLRNITDDEFFRFCQLNRDLRIERTSDGEILIMPPTGGDTGRTNSALNGLLYSWAQRDGTGITFDSSTGFTLANRAKRSPDAAWVKRSRWDALTKQQRQEFPPLCPDFVVELRSPTDSLRTLQAKLREYIANGALLGWLIDPIEKKVYVYRPSAEVTCLDDPKTVSGDPVLPRFVLDLQRLWA